MGQWKDNQGEMRNKFGITLIRINPFLRAYFIPNTIARYSAALLVATPTPSRNQQIFKVKIVKEIIVVYQ